jgi:hypothetical protein
MKTPTSFALPVEGGHPGPEEHGQTEDHHRSGPVGRPQGQPGLGPGHEGLEAWETKEPFT